eukprot:Skav232721  [mRNA]  locus=scaffold4985:73927:75258:+ [translate_table: standard]
MGLQQRIGFQQGRREKPTRLPIDFARKSKRSDSELWPEMFDWVKSTGMDTSDIQVKVTATEDLAKGELGLVTNAPLLAGDILAWAPTSLLLNKGKAVDLWGSLVEDLSDRLALILLLVRERFLQGDASKWHVYMQRLPEFDGDVSGPSFLWSEEEISLLQGSDGHGAALAMYNTIVDEYEWLAANLFEKHPDVFPSETFDFKNYLWGAANVASRAYGDDPSGTNLCIAPLVDFLNHKAGALQLTRFGNGIVAYAHKNYDAGEQVWVSYGGKSNAELLSQYGFVDPDNSQEAVYIRIGTHLPVDSNAKLELISQLLDEQDPASAIFRISRKPREWEPKLMPVLRILSAKEDELPKKAEEMIPRQDPNLEVSAYQLLQQGLKVRENEYPASLEEDKKQLEKLEKEPPVNAIGDRLTLALRLRISEQELLELVSAYASEQVLRAKA